MFVLLNLLSETFVREAGASQHHGASTKVSLKLHDYYDDMIQRGLRGAFK